MLRRLLLVIGFTAVAASGPLAPSLATAGAAQTPPGANAQAPAQTVGIRIVDAPTNRGDDPRARLYIVDHVAPGSTIERRVEVNNSTDSTQAVSVYAASATITDGNFAFGDGRAVNELTTWTSVGPSTLNLAAGAKELVTVTIAIPADASEGERYGVVWAELAAATPPGGGLAAVNRVGVRMYLSVGPGGEPASDFEITALEAKRDAGGSPLVEAVVRNTGGRALDLSGELRLTNGPGGLSAGPFGAKLGTTLGIGETEPVLVTLDPAIPAGPWDARIVLKSSLTERDASATITFPAAASASAGPVPTATGGDDGGGVLPLVAGGAAVALVALGALGVVRHRRRV